MNADIQLSDTFPHGTPDGYRGGCHGSQCPSVIPCRDVARRHAGDFTFRRRFDSGMTPQEILDAEAAQERAEREAARAAKRKPRPGRVRHPRQTIGATTAYQERVAEYHADGLSDKEIAELLGKTREQVRSARRNLNLPLNPMVTTDERIRELHAEGLNDIGIGARLGKASDYIGKRRRNMGLPRNLTHYQRVTDQQIRDAHAAGLTDRELSEQLGADRRTVAKRRRALNLKINKETK